MDALFALIAIATTLLGSLGLLALHAGVDSRDRIGDDHTQSIRS